MRPNEFSDKLICRLVTRSSIDLDMHAQFSSLEIYDMKGKMGAVASMLYYRFRPSTIPHTLFPFSLRDKLYGGLPITDETIRTFEMKRSES